MIKGGVARINNKSRHDALNNPSIASSTTKAILSNLTLNDKGKVKPSIRTILRAVNSRFD